MSQTAVMCRRNRPQYRRQPLRSGGVTNRFANQTAARARGLVRGGGWRAGAPTKPTPSVKEAMTNNIAGVLAVAQNAESQTHGFNYSPKGLGVRSQRSDVHGCTLLDFLAAVRGNDPGTSVDFCECCHGPLWKFAAFHGKCHGS